MAIAYQQSNAAGSTPGTINYTNAVGAGHLLVCGITATSSPINNPPTSPGETWVDSGLGSVSYGLGPSSVAVFFVAGCSAHTAGYTVTASADFAISIYEFSGALIVSPKDTTNSTTSGSSGSGSNNETAGSITPAQAAELFFAYFGTNSGPLSAGTTSVAWNSPTGDVNGLAQYFIATDASAVTANCTTGFGSGDAYAGAFISFKPAPGGQSLILPNHSRIGPSLRI